VSAPTDCLGVEILPGDTVMVSSWGGNVRLTDVGRSAAVTGFTAAGNVRLDDARGEGVGFIARGTAVRPACLIVARRDGQPGHEGNRPEDAKVTVSYGGREVVIDLSGTELSWTEQGGGRTHHYLSNASKDFLGEEIEKALIALTVAP
jgi:hypothetical protein